MNRSEEIRAILGISRAEFSRRYNIPKRTLEDWDSGKSNAPDYVLDLLERVVREDSKALYALILNTRGVEKVVFVGSRTEASKKEDALRKECRRVDPDGAEMDCYVMSEQEAREREENKKLWDSLTDEEKENS